MFLIALAAERDEAGVAGLGESEGRPGDAGERRRLIEVSVEAAENPAEFGNLHGGADARGFASAVRVAVDLAQSDYVSEIRRNLENLTAVLAAQSKARPAESLG